MNEQDFDNRIKERALQHEMQTGSPLWNKKGTWEQIESGLGKKDRTIWWKIAAIVVLFFSLGIVYAQWNAYQHFKAEKDLELAAMKEKTNSLAGELQQINAAIKTELWQKEKELDSLKSHFAGEKTKVVVPNDAQMAELTHKLSAAAQTEKTNRQIIDSLTKTLNSLLASKEQPTPQAPATTPENNEKAKPELTEVRQTPERRIYYINNKIETNQRKKAFKLNILEAPEDKAVEYQSNFSIFNK